MKIEANSVAEYLAAVPAERQAAFGKLRQTILNHLPEGFEEGLQYGMVSYYVPLSRYPDGYHCTPDTPLPFASIASQKKHIALYHSGIYAQPKLHDWFVAEYPHHARRKLDMGKSCIRFKKTDDIPFELLAQLMQKMTVDEWIALYEAKVKR